ncbi:MAG: heterodisulfide reductase-related iron-sulfur binding cluster [Acidimicrobiia bacterium]
MTTTYDPNHPSYLADADLREEMTRVFDLCHGCRLCFKYCTSFPTLFDFIDQLEDQDAGKLTQAQQDQVVDECFQCKLCYVNCPYVPGQHEWALDFPRLMLRANAVRHEDHQTSIGRRTTDSLLGRTDLMGKIGTQFSGIVNPLIAKPGSIKRKLMAKVTGIASQRVLPPYAKTRFSTWFKKRVRIRFENRQGAVGIFPTCFVEYQNPSIGHDAVRVYERNGIECSLIDGARCCGAPSLHAGDIERFRDQAEHNVKALAAVVRQGRDIVVLQPTCSYVLKKDYPDYVEGSDAELVSAHTYDVAEYLMNIHKGENTSLDVGFFGDIPESITYHTPCHLRAQNIGLKSRDLMKLTGAKVLLAQHCSGVDGMWGLRAENYEIASEVGAKLIDEVQRLGGEVVAGDCQLANGAIVEGTGQVPVHPIQIIARAYGIAEEPNE